MIRSPQGNDRRGMVVMLLLSAVSAGLSAAFPMSPAAPVRLNAALSVTGMLLVVGTWVSDRRLWLHLGVIATVVGVTSVVSVAARPAGTATAGMVLTWAVAYAAFFFSRPAARAYTALATSAFALALSVNPYVGAGHVWLLTTMTMVVATEAVATLIGRLEHQAVTDPLTGLLNREGLRRRGSRALAAASRSQAPLSVVVVDLDGFKAVNDRDGHAAGDRLLCALADAWRGQLRSGDVLARTGGDEFVFVLPDTDAQECGLLIARLAGAGVSAWSYGHAVHRPGAGLDELLDAADRALYAAKATRATPRATPAEPGSAPAGA